MVLSAVTLRAFAKGQISDCGCYSGLLTLTPRQSAALNAGYVSILLAAWATLPMGAKGAPWVSGEPWLWRVISVAVVSASAWALLIHAMPNFRGILSKRWPAAATWVSTPGSISSSSLSPSSRRLAAPGFAVRCRRRSDKNGHWGQSLPICDFVL